MSEHPFMKGMGLGMMAGMAAGAAMMKNEKTIKKAAKKTVKSVGQLAEDATNAVVEKMPK